MSSIQLNYEKKSEIENLVSETYAEYGCANARTEVRVDFPKLIISLNHENPYMGDKFWDFLTTLQEKLKKMGYVKTCGNYFGDFYVAEYMHT